MLIVGMRIGIQCFLVGVLLWHLDKHLLATTLEDLGHEFGFDILDLLQVIQCSIQNHHDGVGEVLGVGRIRELFFVGGAYQVNLEEWFDGLGIEQTIWVEGVHYGSIREFILDVGGAIDDDGGGQELANERVVISEGLLAQRQQGILDDQLDGVEKALHLASLISGLVGLLEVEPALTLPHKGCLDDAHDAPHEVVLEAPNIQHLHCIVHALKLIQLVGVEGSHQRKELQFLDFVALPLDGLNALHRFRCDEDRRQQELLEEVGEALGFDAKNLIGTPHEDLLGALVAFQLQHTVVGHGGGLQHLRGVHDGMRHQLPRGTLHVTIKDDVVHGVRVVLGCLHQQGRDLRELQLLVLADEGLDLPLLVGGEFGQVLSRHRLQIEALLDE